MSRREAAAQEGDGAVGRREPGRGSETSCRFIVAQGATVDFERVTGPWLRRVYLSETVRILQRQAAYNNNIPMYLYFSRDSAFFRLFAQKCPNTFT